MTQELSRFHEFMPDKVWKWKILEEKMERILSLHDYQEIRLSVLQDYQVLHTGITALMQGSEADHAVQSVLSITSPDNNLSLLSLRPEGTISVLHHTARIINTGEVHRFYYSGPMFRKAEALKQMEFYQLGVELLGSESILSENEVISLGMKICHDLGLKEVRLDMNSYGCMQCRMPSLPICANSWKITKTSSAAIATASYLPIHSVKQAAKTKVACIHCKAAHRLAPIYAPNAKKTSTV